MSYLSSKSCSVLWAILFAYNTISGERGGWHPKTGAIQSDSERHTHIRQIPWWHVVSVSNRCDEFRCRKSLSLMPRLLPILMVAIYYVSSWSSVFRCYTYPSVIFWDLLLSVRTENGQATTLILSMFIWGILTTVHSNVATFAVAKFPPSKSQPEEEMLQQIGQIWEDFQGRTGYLYPQGIRLQTPCPLRLLRREKCRYG